MQLPQPDILVVIQNEGGHLRRVGKTHRGNCLMCDGKSSGSMSVDPERQTFHCFRCGRGGDAISFIQAKRQCTFIQALEILGIDAGKPYRPDPRETEKRKLVSGFRMWCRDHGNELARELRALRRVVAEIRTPEDMVLRAWVFHEIPTLDYKLDVLSFGSDEAKYNLRKEAMAHGQE